ncbi:hypothetical protein [Candidatus Spongiihabitans sp.]|uniref:hypothetical protein n=1 Tax=Candidatus Spongiihabitans sp. TaxID=3101308 RepID=UPI003C7B9163
MRESMWLINHPSVLTVRYEDLAGKCAGGSEARQRQILKKLADHLNRAIDIDEAMRVCSRTDTFTFYKGKIGRWQDVFTDKICKEFNHHFALELEQLGYSDTADD